MQQAPDPSPWNETAFNPYGGAQSWNSPCSLPHSSYTHGSGPVALSYNDTLQRPMADVSRDNDYRYRTSGVRVVTVTHVPMPVPHLSLILCCCRSCLQVSRTGLEKTGLGVTSDASNDKSGGGDAHSSRRPLRSSTMAMRAEKGTSTSLVSPNIQSVSVSSLFEPPNAARTHPAVTPNEQDAGAALVTLAGLPKPAATKVTEPQTPRENNWQPTFPELVHAMVTETAATQPDLIEWVQDGQAFIVHNPVSEYFSCVSHFQDFIYSPKYADPLYVTSEE